MTQKLKNSPETKEETKQKMLPLTSDIVFKRVFSREGNEKILKDLLEAILEIKIKGVVVKNPEAKTKLEQWLWLIVGGEEKIEMAEKENKEIEKAMDIIKEMSMDPKEWELYESRRLAIMDYNTGMEQAKLDGIEERNAKTEWKNGKKERKRGTDRKKKK